MGVDEVGEGRHLHVGHVTMTDRWIDLAGSLIRIDSIRQPKINNSGIVSSPTRL